MRIAVVIPTYKRHLPFVPRLLDSINKQTRFPDLVVIRASSCGPEEKSLLQDIKALPLNFRLILEETERVCTAGENRNEGVALVPPEFELISFFDSDDLMHPQRIEILERCFLEDSSADVVTHSAIHGPLLFDTVEWPTLEKQPKIHREAASLKYEEIYSPYTDKTFEIFRVVFDEDIPPQFCGHSTIRRHCFEKIQYRSEAYGYEDTQFLAELYREGYGFVAITTPLHYYSHISTEETNTKAADAVKGLL